MEKLIGHLLDAIIIRLLRFRHGVHGLLWLAPGRLRFLPLNDRPAWARCDREGAGIVELVSGSYYEFRQDGHLYPVPFQSVHHGVATIHATPFLGEPGFLQAFERALALYPDGEGERGNLLYEVYTVASLARQSVDRPGDLLEIGVSWGVFARAIAEHAGLAQRPHKRFFLVDAWQGRYSHADSRRDEGDCGDYCADAAHIARAFADIPNVEVRQGIAPDSIDHLVSDGFSFVHIDIGYDEETEIACLEKVVPRCLPGAIIVVESCYLNQGYGPRFHQAVAALGLTITGTVQGQGIIIVPPQTSRAPL